MARTLRLFAPPKRVTGRLLWIFVTLLIVAPLLLSTGWILAQYAIDRTTDEVFCTTCHSMEPMGQSYAMDLHGGRSTHGVTASCSDCHLPHDSPPRFIWAYWRRLLGDAWIEMIHGTDTADWNALRDERDRYVFDSGCLTCHVNLLEAFPRNAEAFSAHEAYFLDDGTQQCVSCHTSVGHKDLDAYLNKSE